MNQKTTYPSHAKVLLAPRGTISQVEQAVRAWREKRNRRNYSDDIHAKIERRLMRVRKMRGTRRARGVLLRRLWYAR